MIACTAELGHVMLLHVNEFVCLHSLNSGVSVACSSDRNNLPFRYFSGLYNLRAVLAGPNLRSQYDYRM